MKNCIICESILNKDNTTWYRQKNYIYKCNECIKIEKRNQSYNFRKNNPSLANDRSTKSRLKSKKLNPVKYTANQMRSSSFKRAKALGLDFDITSDFIYSICKEECPILGVKLKYGGGDKAKNSASLDRIDSFKGYTKDNVMVISSLANTMKSNATKDELLKFGQWVVDNINK